MPDEGRLISRNIKRLWEVLFSLHLAFWGMSMGFVTSDAAVSRLSRMDARINQLLHIRQTDFVRGYFAIWIPSVVVAFLIWVVLRTFSRTRVTQEVLRSLAGVLTIFAPPAYWVSFYERTFWTVGWPYRGAPFEMGAALVATLLFLSGKWKVPSWAGLVLLAGHYAYWYFAMERVLFATNYASPAGPILGFCSALAWGLYVSRLRAVKAGGLPLVP
jgi:hypothetical protein